METSTETLKDIIASSSYSKNGSETEKAHGYILSELFPNSETFWKTFIVPLTNRIDNTITDYQKSITPRDGVAQVLQDIGSFHYTIFHNFIFAHAALHYRQPSFFENFYTHLSTICDCVEEFLIILYFIILECKNLTSSALHTLSKEQFNEVANSWYDNHYSALFENYLSKGKYTKIEIFPRGTALEEYFKGVPAWKNYFRFSQGIKQYWNVIVHHYTIAFFIDTEGHHHVPKKEVIKEYKRWTDLDKAKNNPSKFESDFIIREVQMVQDLNQMKTVLQALWEKPIKDMTELFLIEKNDTLLSKYNLKFT